MTPEQELAVKRAEAVARAEAKAQAEQDATTQTEGQPGFWGGVKAAARSAGQGIVSIADIPTQAVTALRNVPALTTNAAIEAAKHATPEQLRERGINPDVAKMQPEATLTSPDYNTAAYQELAGKPDPSHPWINTVGQVAGPAIVEAAATGGGSLLTLPGALAVTRRAAATTGGTLIGGEAGKQTGKYAGRGIDYLTGGQNAESLLQGFGELVGGGFGGGVAPDLLAQTTWKGFSKGLTETERNPKTGLSASEERLAIIDRLNRLLPPEKQIPVSASLVGNKLAGQLEALTTTPPLGGGPAYRSREAQQLGLDAAAQQIAANMRGQPSAVEGINPSTIGQGVRDTAAAADEAAKAAADAAMDPMAAQVGRSTPINQTTQLDQMETVRRGSQPQYRAPVEREIANVNASRTDPLNPPKVVDPALEAQLQMQLNQATRQKAAATNATQVDAAQAQIEAVQAQIDKNRGQTFQDTIESRSRLTDRVEGQIPLDQKQTLAIKAAQTEAMKEAARLAGVPPKEFDAAFSEYGRIEDQRAIFDKLMNNAGQGEAYNQLFSGTSTQNLDRFRALREHAPEKLRQILADQYEIKMRGVGAGLPPNASTLAPTAKTGPDWWAALPKETRHFTAGTLPNYDDAKALEVALRSDARRPARTLPGQGGAVTGSNIFKQAAAPLTGGGAGFFLGGLPGAFVGAVGPSIVANLTGRALTNPNLVRRLVTPGPWTQGQSLSRILAAASANPGPTVYRPSPLDEQGAH